MILSHRPVKAGRCCFSVESAAVPIPYSCPAGGRPMAHLSQIIALATVGMAAPAFAQTGFAEVEPNETKAQATPVAGMVSGDTITGNTIGTSASPGPASVDYFRIKTAPLTAGIYRHRLTLTTAGTAGHVGNIRGLAQSSGVPTPNSDTAVQVSSANSTPPRFNQWYGFGREEELYYRVNGGATTTADYTATLETTPVAPVPIATGFAVGSLTITTVGQTGATQTDTDLWVYDSNLSPIVGFGNDDETSGITHGSTLTRTFAAGPYYLAISNYNTCNNLGSPPDDAYGQGAVTDFPNLLVNSAALVGATLDVSFRISDSAQTSVFTSAIKTGSFDVFWYTITVGSSTGGGCYPNCDASTAPPVLNANDFQCFLNAFAAQASYANCDLSTADPVLNANDFQCFLNMFAAGCT